MKMGAAPGGVAIVGVVMSSVAMTNALAADAAFGRDVFQARAACHNDKPDIDDVIAYLKKYK